MKLEYNRITLLLAEKNIKLIEENNKIYIDPRNTTNIPLEDHEGILLIEEKWYYCKFIREKREPINEIMKRFSSKEEALNYLFLKQLNKYFIFENILPTRNFNIKDWDIETVIDEMNKLNIPLEYLSYKENIHGNSILFELKDSKWHSGYIDNKKEIIYENKKGIEDSNWFLSLFANKVYVLYLFDMYIQDLNSRGFNMKEITNQDKLVILGYE
ncbi:hypothetical protein [Clostridium sp.]|uniref:hypothetical protein n=1 Tax=Clostridium sp. TaxID=1506 RepID=UPI003217359E